MAKKDPSFVEVANSGQFIAKNAAASDNFRIVGGQLSHWDKAALKWLPIVDQQHLAALCCELYAVNRTLGLTATLTDAVEGRVGRLASGRINADFAKRGLSNVSTPRNLWGFASGVFDVNNPQDGIRKADKGDYVTHFLPYDMEANAELPGELANVIFSAVEQSDAMTGHLLDILCYILFDDNRFQRFFSWYGIGGAGKGLLTRLVIALLGRNRCYSLDTDALYQGRSDQLVAADGKQLLVLQEADRAMPKAKLKALTGEDVIQVRALYGAPFEFTFDGQFLMVSNPPFPESMVDTGILRRIIPIQFSRAAAQPDLTLEPRLLSMLGRICGALFARWQSRVKDWIEWPMQREVLRDLEFYKFQEDSPKAWLIEHVKKDVDGALKMSEILTRYEMEKGELKDKERERIKKAFQRAIRSDLGVKLKNSREYAASWITGDEPTPDSEEHTQDSVQTPNLDAAIDAHDLLPEETGELKMQADLYFRVTDKKPAGDRFGSVLWSGEMCKDEVLNIRAGRMNKTKLPALTPSIHSASGQENRLKSRRTDENTIRFHNGWLVFDVDDVEDVSSVKRKLLNLGFVTASWVSPSGNGVKFLVQLAGKPPTIEAHKAVYMDVVRAVKATTGLECDESCANPSRLCFLSWDELPMLNFSAASYRPSVGARAFDLDFPIDGPWPEGERHKMLVKCAAHYWQTVSKDYWPQIVQRLRATFEWEKRENLADNPALKKEFDDAIRSVERKYPR